MKNKKDNFKVYSNSNIPKKKRQEEITVELEIPHEDTLTGLFVSSPYFMDLMMAPDYFYYPVDVEAEESLMAPLLNVDVLHEFLDKTEFFCKKQNIPAIALLHVSMEDEEEENMMPVFDGFFQGEILKFFRTVVATMNQDIAFEEEFEEIFQKLVDESADNGYLDNVLNSLAEYLNDPEVMEAVLFPEFDEE